MQDSQLARIASEITGFVRGSYPEMTVRVENWEQDPSRIAAYFIEKRFEGLYRRQRYHYLLHLIPKDYFDTVLADSIWYELTPDESIDTLAEDPDEDLIASITPDVLGVLLAKRFFAELDELFCPEVSAKKSLACSGDFRHAKKVLEICGFKGSLLSDVFHVLMAQGAFCDCEILYNVAPESRLKANHWQRQIHEAVDSEAQIREGKTKSELPARTG